MIKSQTLKLSINIMKKFTALFLLLFSSCATISNVSKVNINEGFPHNEIQKIAVIKFKVSDKKDKLGSKAITVQDAGDILATATALELEKWGKYIVINREALKEELKLKNLREKDFLQTEDYSTLGKTLGVDAIVIGKVEDCGVSYSTISSRFILTLVTKVSFTASCIDVSTNETIWDIKIAGSSGDDNERVLAAKLLAKAINTLKTKLN